MIYNDDCFNIFKLMVSKSVDLVVVDLPYGQTQCAWDIKIDLKEMWKELKRIGKVNCIYVFFTTTKYGNELINSNINGFQYDLVWEKANSVGFLRANDQPLRQHEMIYVFKSGIPISDVNIEYNKELREYAEKLNKYINKSRKQLKEELGNGCTEHFLGSYNSTQFSLPSLITYNKLIKLYEIEKMDGFMTYEDMRKKRETVKTIKQTYNPQKTIGKPYKAPGGRYVQLYDKINTGVDNKGDRHPTSIIKGHNTDEKLHPTQKPVSICEWLIKTYSNEGDMVLDFTIGSGSTIIACINTNRKYIGIEKDKEIFKIANDRINEHLHLNMFKPKKKVVITKKTV